MKPLGPWKEPSLGLIYGPPDGGKTTDLVYSFAGSGLFLVPRGALKGGLAVAGVDLFGAELSPQVVWSRKCAITVSTLPQATTLVRDLGAKGGTARFRFVVVDDISILMRKTYRVLKAKMGTKAKKNGFLLWAQVGDALQAFADACDASGVHCWSTAHESAAETDEKTGREYRGGPMMPSRSLRALLPYLFDEVWRVAKDSQRPGLWKGVYLADENDAEWLTKSRHNLVRSSVPTVQNTGELLRHAGFDVPRIEGPGEWMEKAAELVSRLILEGEPIDEVTSKVATALYRKHNRPLPLIRWAVHRDGVDRALLRQRDGALLQQLGIV